MSSKNLRYKFDTDEDDRKLLSSHSSSYSLKNVLRDRQYKKKIRYSHISKSQRKFFTNKYHSKIINSSRFILKSGTKLFTNWLNVYKYYSVDINVSFLESQT